MQQTSTKVYKTRYDRVGKVNHCELCKKVKFYHTNKWQMRKPKSILKNEKHKILLYFVIQIDHLIQLTRPDLFLTKKEPVI